jgi:hypothetical protein
MDTCVNCSSNCLETYSDKCVLYTGSDYPLLGIQSGEYYDKVILDMLENIKSLVESEVDMDCLYGTSCETCDRKVPLKQGVQNLVDHLCSLTTKDMDYTGERLCIGDGSISTGTLHLLNKEFIYSVGVETQGSTVSYNLDQVSSTLPSNYRLGRVSAVLSGESKSGRTIIADTNKIVAGIPVSNDRYPLHLDLDVRVNTPTGDVKLTKSISIPSPSTGSFTERFNVQDFGTDNQDSYTLESFIETMAAQVCSNTSTLNSYKSVSSGGVTGDIATLVAQQYALVVALNNRVTELESLINSMNSGSQC